VSRPTVSTALTVAVVSIHPIRSGDTNVFPSASVLPASQTVVKLAAVADAEGALASARATEPIRRPSKPVDAEG